MNENIIHKISRIMSHYKTLLIHWQANEFRNASSGSDETPRYVKFMYVKLPLES